MSNKTTWIILILLTVIGFIFSESSFFGASLALVLAVLYGIKFLGIGFQFMELNKAHIIWKVLLVTILLVFVSFISYAYTLQ